MAIQSTVLSTAAAANIIVGSGTLGTATTTIYLCNRTSANLTVNVYAVTGTGIVANGNNIIYANVPLTGYETYIMDLEKIYLNPGDSLRANATIDNSVIATVSTIGL